MFYIINNNNLPYTDNSVHAINNMSKEIVKMMKNNKNIVDLCGSDDTKVNSSVKAEYIYNFTGWSRGNVITFGDRVDAQFNGETDLGQNLVEIGIYHIMHYIWKSSKITKENCYVVPLDTTVYICNKNKADSDQVLYLIKKDLNQNLDLLLNFDHIIFALCTGDHWKMYIMRNLKGYVTDDNTLSGIGDPMILLMNSIVQDEDITNAVAYTHLRAHET